MHCGTTWISFLYPPPFKKMYVTQIGRSQIVLLMVVGIMLQHIYWKASKCVQEVAITYNMCIKI